jgi:uncharacterized membrane protein
MVTGAALWPWWTRVWAGRRDQGAGLWPVGGLLIYLLVMQMLRRTGWLHLHTIWAWLVVITLGVAGHLLLPKPPLKENDRTLHRSSALQALGIFTLLFVFWTLVRSADPGVSHTEQPMDAMWMRTALASDAPPLRDSWFGGAPATYYAEGHQALAFVAVLFGTPAPVAVNTGQILWFAMTGLLAFQVGRSLCADDEASARWRGGILGLLLMLFVSTVPGFYHALGEDGFWWWWDASRILQDGTTPLITEFPFFSFYLGDNHAHLLGVPVLLISLLAAIQLFRSEKLNFILLLPVTVAIAWSWRMNPWQTPTSIALPLLALFCRRTKLTANEWTALALALWASAFLYLPRLAPGPELALVRNQEHHISPAELSLVFGFLLPGAAWAVLYRPRRLTVALLLLTAGMWAVCELVFLQDAFQSRMNTIFKVYFQMWILLAAVAAAGWSRSLDRGSLKPAAIISLLVCLIPGLLYAGRLSWKSLRPQPRSLHAWSVLPENDRTLLHAADRIIQPDDLILEAPGNSYQANTSQLGTWTAGHSLLGWRGHQSQWRPGQPQPDPLRVYRASSPEDLDRLLKDVQPQWVFLGTQERASVKLHPDWFSWMDKRADRIIDQENQILYRLR